MRPLPATALACVASHVTSLVLVKPRSSTSLVARRVSYLSTVEDDDQKKRRLAENPGDTELPSDPRDHSGVYTESINEGPANYEGFVDAEGFDGGDGQVGVVGDGTNAMESFDQSRAVTVEAQARKRIAQAQSGVKSKQRSAKNAWGVTSGYAEDLEKRGMVKLDEYGEDRLKQRRQQLENWRNQGELRLQKDEQMRNLAELQGKKYQPSRQGTYLSSFDQPKAKAVRISAKDAPVLAAGDKVYGDLKFVARIDNLAGTTVEIENEYSTYAEFQAGFTAGTDEAFAVDPAHGTLNRRGDPNKQTFTITFAPGVYKETFEGTFVVVTEDHTWTYNLRGSNT